MGRKLIISLTTLCVLLSVIAKQAMADNTAGRSAAIAYNITEGDKKESPDYFKKKYVIKKVLEKYNSPMASTSDDFINVCIKYNLDCYLLPSIAGLESFFGSQIYANSNNPFGWGRGLIMFKDWPEAIDTVGQGLRENYINKGADSVEKIGAIYCEGNTWAGKVNYFINQFKQEEEKISLFLEQNPVKL